MRQRFRIRNIIDISSILLFVIIFTSCQELTVSAKMGKHDTKASEELGAAVLWQQTSAEARALYYQIFYFAKTELSNKLTVHSGKPAAIVLDIDETVLDNSPYEAMLYKDGRDYPYKWKEWIEYAGASAVPGVLDFLNYAQSRQVQIFYVTNRKEAGRAATLKNLTDLDFPFAVNDHLLMRTEENDKSARRKRVSEDFDIILYLGDNLGDFDNSFQDLPVKQRAAMVDSLRHEFGTRFIILPNPMYGDWLGAVYDYDYGHDKDEKRQMRIDALRVFEKAGH